MELVIAETTYVGPRLEGGFKTIIDEENMERFILKALENYSFPIQTLVQEYINNAKDSCREAGKPDSAMYIHIPTVANPTFIIRDYGMGLDNDGIINVYRKLGTSTKGKGNDLSDNLAGGYGAGAKIWIRYTDACIIRAWKNGRRIEYLAHTANSKLGEYLLQSDEPSDEPNGVEIEIALKSTADVAEFRRAIRRMFLFWKEKPQLSEPMKWPMIHYEDDYMIFCDEGTLSEMSISVDGTVYSLPKTYGSVVKSGILARANDIKCKLVLKSRITDIFVPMNREQVADDDKLLAYLKSVIEGMNTGVNGYANSILDKQFETMSELRQAVNKASDHIKIGKRKFRVDKIDRNIVRHENNTYLMESKNTDLFDLFQDQNRDPKYEATSTILGNHVIMPVEKLTPYYIKKVKKAFDDKAFNIWRNEVPESLIDFFGIDTYEEICPKKMGGRSGGGGGGYYSSTKLTNRQVHYKDVESSGRTLELSEFINQFPADIPLITTELVNNTADFQLAKWVKYVAEFRFGKGKYNHACLSSRTIRLLKDAGYDNFHPISTIKITDSVVKAIAERSFTVPGILKYFESVRERLADPELEEMRAILRRRLGTEGYGICDTDYLEKAEVAKYEAHVEELNEKAKVLTDRYPMLKMDEYRNYDVAREVVKWLCTNLGLLSPTKRKVAERNNLEAQTTDLT